MAESVRDLMQSSLLWLTSSDELPTGITLPVAVAGIVVVSTLLLVRCSRPGRNKNKFPNAVTVLVDMDGVVCDFESHALKQYMKLYPDLPTIPLEKRTQFYATSQYGEEFGEESKQRIRDIIQKKGFFENLPPVPNAVEAVKQLAECPNVTVFFCTSPLTAYEHVVVEKYRWIEKHFGNEWTKRIIMTRDKTMVKGDILIDDRPVIDGHQLKPEWTHVLFSASCNTHLCQRARIKSWQHEDWKPTIDELVRRLQEK